MNANIRVGKGIEFRRKLKCTKFLPIWEEDVNTD